jgi:hypothetical protein
LPVADVRIVVLRGHPSRPGGTTLGCLRPRTSCRALFPPRRLSSGRSRTSAVIA